MTQSAFEQRVTELTETLYRISATLLPRLCDRQDAVQSCILRAWQHMDHMRNPDAFRPWLIRILINECRTLLRKNRRIVLAEAPEPANPHSPVDTHLRDQELWEALQALPEKQRIAVVLHYIEGASVQEVADTLRVPVGTVKSRLHTAREALREMLGEGGSLCG